MLNPILRNDVIGGYIKQKKEREAGNEGKDVSFDINPDSYSIKKKYSPKGSKDPNALRMCIGGECYDLKKDNQGNYQWPKSPVPPPRVPPQRITAPRVPAPTPVPIPIVVRKVDRQPVFEITTS